MKRGFTLIELLVVISIIGILTILLFANFTAVRERGRDAQRKSDLRNIQTALRLYYNDHGSYPTDNASYQIVGCGAASCPWGVPWVDGTVTYIATMPKDPLSTRSYRYDQIDDDNYTLKACLENASDDKCNSTVESWCTDLSGCLYVVQP